MCPYYYSYISRWRDFSPGARFFATAKNLAVRKNGAPINGSNINNANAASNNSNNSSSSSNNSNNNVWMIASSGMRTAGSLFHGGLAASLLAGGVLTALLPLLISGFLFCDSSVSISNAPTTGNANLRGQQGQQMNFDFTKPSGPLTVTALILTYKNAKAFADFLPTVLAQRKVNFEVLIADSGCLPETQETIRRNFANSVVPYKHLPICHNPGYAVANNEASKFAAESSDWILLLNDDLILEGETFIHDMLELGKRTETAAGVGCSLLTTSVDDRKIIEAGSIIWGDSSTMGFGRGRSDIDAPEFAYPRPVDYVSGACLMMQKLIFNEYGGFDSDRFPNYYEDTDLQMHVQHDLGLNIWLQPSARALHVEHGSFSAEDIKAYMQKGSKVFVEKWGEALAEKHARNPWDLDKRAKKVAFLKAGDVRGRDPTKARILYLDVKIPSRNAGSGFGRSFDNISMLAQLGHRVTVASYHDATDDWCDAQCRKEITDLGVEVISQDWEGLMESRLGFYQIVVVSRPTTFRIVHKKLRELFKKSPFALVYDCEALWYRRDETMTSLYEAGVEFPSIKSSEDYDFAVTNMIANREAETTLLSLVDVVIPVSTMEEEIVRDLVPDVGVRTVGHIMSLDKVTRSTFQEREGIMFLASFSGSMYYNGDAVWYFLKTVYPLVLEASSKPIPLTIAGRKIPADLREFVDEAGLQDDVTFLESPEDLEPLYERHRVFIAPHMYGSGIQFKLSEALSLGIPTVMSAVSAEAFGITTDDGITCRGDDPEAFKSCVISLHENKKEWEAVREGGIEFIRTTHSRVETLETWTDIVERGKQVWNHLDEISRNPQGPCPEGEESYLSRRPDVKEAVEAGALESAYVHWIQHGRKEGLEYLCFEGAAKVHNLFRNDIWLPQAPCEVGETMYVRQFPDVGKAMKAGSFESAFQHWKDHGIAEERVYYCPHT